MDLLFLIEYLLELPAFPPTISVGREPFDYGDLLRANCTSPPARPAARLKFYLNQLLVRKNVCRQHRNFRNLAILQVASSPPLSSREAQERRWSDLALELSLHEYHFNQGRLILRCVSQVANIYHEEAVLELASARNPVPEKGKLQFRFLQAFTINF